MKASKFTGAINGSLYTEKTNLAYEYTFCCLLFPNLRGDIIFLA